MWSVDGWLVGLELFLLLFEEVLLSVVVGMRRTPIN